MQDWPWTRRLRYGAWQAVGLGFLAASFEITFLATSMKLPLSVMDFGVLVVVDAVIMGALGAVAGVLAGLIVLPDQRAERPAGDAIASQLGMAAALLAALYLFQGAYTVYSEEQPLAAGALMLIPAPIGGMVYLNARYWLRKVELNKSPPIGFIPVAAAVCGVIGLVAALAYPQRDTGGAYALEGDPNVILITVDGLGRGDVGVYGGPETPRLAQLAQQAVVLDNAVTPAVFSGPSNAAVLTGLHPLRLKFLMDGDRLSTGYRTLAEALAVEGYATGGFVSSGHVGVSGGLDQGFRVFDDDFAPLLPGVSRVNLVSWLRWAQERWLGLPPQARTGEETVDRFRVWYAQKSDLPHFGWVHLTEPLQGLSVDGLVGEVIDAVEDAGRADDTLVIVAGTFGQPPGAPGLTEPEVRVPLVMRIPGQSAVRVDAQVRLMDVGATAMDYLNLDTLGETEGVSLMEFASGARKAWMSCALIGPDASGQPILGLRNSGIKWIRTPEDGDQLFKIDTDPDQTEDLAEERADAVVRARKLMTADIIAFRNQMAVR